MRIEIRNELGVFVSVDLAEPQEELVKVIKASLELKNLPHFFMQTERGTAYFPGEVFRKSIITIARG